MFARMGMIAKSGLGFIEAQATLAEVRLLRIGLLVACLLAAGCVGAVGLCGVLAAVVLLIAPFIGIAPALLLVAGFVVVAAAVSLALAYSSLAASLAKSEIRSTNSRKRFIESLTPEESADGAESPGVAGDLIAKAVNAVASRPGLVTSASFAVMTVFGIRRTARLLRAAAALASAGAIASRAAAAVSTTSNGRARDGQPTRAAADRPPHEDYARARETT